MITIFVITYTLQYAPEEWASLHLKYIPVNGIN